MDRGQRQQLGLAASGFGVNWGPNQGSPGLDSSFGTTDTATFNGAGPLSIDLSGVNPSLLPR